VQISFLHCETNLLKHCRDATDNFKNYRSVGVHLFDLNLNIDGLLFMETLLNAIKNEIISFQSHFLKWKNAIVSSLKADLVDLKKITIATLTELMR
jgi:hypothetical protein